MIQPARATRLLALLPLALAAAEPRPDDYAYGWTVVTEGAADFHRLALPREVIAASQDPALADLRVFDDDDRPVPSFLVAPDLAPAVEPAPVALPLFESVERLAASAPRAEIALRTDGGAIDARISVGDDGSQAAGVRSWYALLDEDQVRSGWQDAVLAWDAGAEPQVVSLEIAVSDDLQDWRTVANGAVARFAAGAARLERDRIEIGNRDLGRYLRVTAVGAPAGWRLTGLSLVPVTDRIEPERAWTEEPVRPEANALELDLGGALRIDRFELALDDGAGLVRVRLSSADAAGGPWTARGEGLFYRLESGGFALSGPAASAPALARYWRAELIGHNGQRGRLRLGWLPTDLVFVAQGRPPYRVVAGRAATPGPVQPLGGDAQRLWREGRGATASATLGPRFELAGERALRPPLVRDWRTWALWALLALGVLAVLAMAAQLLRENRAG